MMMKRFLILLVCALFLLSAAACAAESPGEASAASAIDDVFTGIEDALETETGEESGVAIPSLAAKEGGAVLIYNGEVAAEGCPEALAAVAESMGLDVVYFDSAEALLDRLSEASVCMIGGTEDDLDPLVSQFTPDMLAELNSWVESGGGYLGICGGAYIGSKGWEDSGGFTDMLNLAPIETEEYLSDPDPRIITVDWNGEPRSIYYAYGPAFLAEGVPDTEIIATYDDGRTAALDYSFGEGHVILCGPHPEADETWLDDDPAPLDADQWEDTTDLIRELFQRLD